MKIIITFLILFIVVASSLQLEFFNKENRFKNAYYKCTQDNNTNNLNCEYDGNIPNSAPSNEDELNKGDYYYCATGTGYGCNGEFKCKRPSFLTKCPNIAQPYSKVNLNNSETTERMKKYNEYLKTDTVSKYCDKVFDLCTADKNKNYNDITKEGLKELNKLGFTQLDEDNKSNLACKKILSESPAKYCTKCSYNYIKSNPKFEIYNSEKPFGGYLLPGINYNELKKSYYISDNISI